jgi:hypothetical protein
MHTLPGFKLVLALVALISLAGRAATPAAGQQVSLLGPSGGSGGKAFSDCSRLVINGMPAAPIEIRVRQGRWIDAIQAVYSDEQLTPESHGGPFGSLSSFRLLPGEYITAIGGKYGKFIDSLFIRTSNGRSFGWGGSGGNTPFLLAAPTGSWVYGFWGRSYCLGARITSKSERDPASCLVDLLGQRLWDGTHCAI